MFYDYPDNNDHYEVKKAGFRSLEGIIIHFDYL